MTTWTLNVHPGHLAVCRLPVGAALPDWASATDGPITSLTRTAAETSIVCAADVVPEHVTYEGPFTALAVAGPLDFALAGVLAELLTPLAEAGVSVFTISTFDTDWILVPADRTGAAIEALRRRGHTVTEGPTSHPTS
ncbi:MAG: ACT domain-containing protein [Jiangellaceae bacterium]